MILCDVGNTNVHLYEDGKVRTISFDELKLYRPDEDVFYINVNKNVKINASFINLAKIIKFKTSYSGLGVDRAFACYAVDTGVVVDSGSATTIDVMNNGFHLGGVILPGLEAYQKCYEQISPALKCILNTQISLDTLPQQTGDAISYAIIKSTIDIIASLSEGRDIYFTGGNGAFFSRYFDGSFYNKNLVFDGMKKVIQEEQLC